MERRSYILPISMVRGNPEDILEDILQEWERPSKSYGESENVFVCSTLDGIVERDKSKTPLAEEIMMLYCNISVRDIIETREFPEEMANNFILGCVAAAFQIPDGGDWFVRYLYRNYELSDRLHARIRDVIVD